jgi:hypothetical protein
VIASGDAALVSAVKSTAADQLAAGEVYKALSEKMKTPVLALCIDYPKFSAVMKSATEAAAMFAPPGSALPTNAYQQFEHMGKVGVGVGYQPGVLKLSFVQQLKK